MNRFSEMDVIITNTVRNIILIFEIVLYICCEMFQICFWIGKRIEIKYVHGSSKSIIGNWRFLRPVC